MPTTLFDAHARQRTWSPLSSHETVLVNAELSKASDQVNELESLMLSPEQEFHKLKAQKDKLLRHFHVHQSLLAPIRSLPLEILSEIFYHCTRIDIAYVEDRMLEMATDVTTRSDVPVAALSQVCSTWNIALANSLYAWSTICLSIHLEDVSPPPRISIDEARKVEQTLARAVSRSGRSPLFISITCSQLQSTKPMRKEQRCILDLLLDQCHRWKTANIILDINSKDDWILPKLSRHIPILHSLTFFLEMTVDTDEEEPLGASGSFSDAPISTPCHFQLSRSADSVSACVGKPSHAIY